MVEPAQSARDVAFDRLAAHVRRFPDLPLAVSGGPDLSARDAGLARAIEGAAVRHWLALEAVARSRVTRPWENVQSEIRAALLGASAQLLMLDRLPDHAVADHAVNWTRGRLNPRAAGFVNAVLRQVIALRGELCELPENHDEMPADLLPRSDGRAWRLNEPIFPDTALARLAQQTSHPEALVSNWVRQFGNEEARRIALHNLALPPIILTGGEPAAWPSDAPLVPHAQPGFAVYTGELNGLAPLLASNPGLRVQDPASASALSLCVNFDPARIADLCAGKGTKTAQLAQMHPDAEIVASDPDAARAAVLRARFEDDPRVIIIDADEWQLHAQSFDLVVLDVPCSNTGVLPRRIEAKHRWSKQRQSDVAALQQRIITEGLRVRRPQGRLLYSTCSLEREENEHQAATIAKWHPLRVEREQRTMPAGRPGGAATAYHDGGYAVLMGG